MAERSTDRLSTDWAVSREVVKPVEGHLLICQACRDGFDATEGYLQAIRVAARTVVESR